MVNMFKIEKEEELLSV